jgi:hypothetical protein
MHFDDLNHKFRVGVSIDKRLAASKIHHFPRVTNFAYGQFFSEDMLGKTFPFVSFLIIQLKKGKSISCEI